MYGLRARGGVEAEGGAAGDDDGVDALHRLRRIEQGTLAGAGPAAADVDRGDRRRIEDDDGRTGAERGVAGMADPHAGNIGNQVA